MIGTGRHGRTCGPKCQSGGEKEEKHTNSISLKELEEWELDLEGRRDGES